MPDFSTAEIWTNTSLPPSFGEMKPKPLLILKNFTVPVAIVSTLLIAGWRIGRSTIRPPVFQNSAVTWQIPEGQQTRQQQNLERQGYKPVRSGLQMPAGALCRRGAGNATGRAWNAQPVLRWATATS